MNATEFTWHASEHVLTEGRVDPEDPEPWWYEEDAAQSVRKQMAALSGQQPADAEVYTRPIKLLTSANTGVVRKYRPLVEEPALFRIFADTEPTPKSILAFVNKYGPLAFAQQFVDAHGQQSAGERLEIYEAHIADLREIVTLWDAVQYDNPRDVLRNRFYVKDQLLFFRRSNPLADVFFRCILWRHREKSVDQDLGNVDDFRLREGDDIKHWALVVVQSAINARLQQLFVSPVLLGNEQPGQDEPLFTLGLHPRTLVAAMWLQLAQAVSGDLTYRQCEWCHKWFERRRTRSKRRTRSDRKYCADKCKTAANRAKRAVEAREGGAK